MKAIIGLGNPGGEYKNTRHNIGFSLADDLKEHWDFPLFSQNERFSAMISSGKFSAETTHLVKPLTFMNASGKTVSQIKEYYQLQLSDILIIHDDIDIEFGKWKFTQSSRSAGQRGVQNIIDLLGTQDLPRLRIGVGYRPELIPTNAFVLGKFSADEQTKLKETLTNSLLGAVEDFMRTSQKDTV